MTPSAAVVLALEWLRLDEVLKAAKAAEGEKRAELLAACFPAGLEHGTNTRDFGGGYVVKAVVTPAPKMPDIPGLRRSLSKLIALGEAGALLAERLVRWKPDLSISEWKKLTDKQRKLFADTVSIGSSGAAVSLKVPA